MTENDGKVKTAMDEPLNIEAILAASESQSNVLSAAAKMTDAERSAMGLTDFYNAAVKQGFDPKILVKEDPPSEPVNAADERVETRIDDFIGSWTMNRLRYDTKNGKAKNVTVRINSPGGFAFTAYGIYDYLRQISREGGNVTTIVEGRAASAGALVFMAGDKREMAKEMSTIMFHRALGGLFLLTFGNADDLESVDVAKAKANAVNPLKRIDEDIAKMLLNRTEMDEKAVAKLLKQDSYMDAEEAISKGIATDLVAEKSGDKEKAAVKPAAGDKPEETEVDRGDHDRRRRNTAIDRDVVNCFVMGR